MTVNCNATPAVIAIFLLAIMGLPGRLKSFVCFCPLELDLLRNLLHFDQQTNVFYCNRTKTNSAFTFEWFAQVVGLSKNIRNNFLTLEEYCS